MRIRSILYLAPILSALLTTGARGGYHAYYNFLWDYPEEAEAVGWHQEAQGLANDDNYWYIVDNGFQNTAGDEHIWKIPVEHDLSEPALNHPGTIVLTNSDIPEIPHLFDHFGDPDLYEYEGHRYLLVPVDNGSTGIAVFESVDSPNALIYLGWDDLTAESYHGWCAVNPVDGRVYSSGTVFTAIQRYRIEWQLLDSRTVVITHEATIPVYDGIGGNLTFHHMQGGDFSPDGELLYIASGGADGHYMWEGLKVIRTSDWQLIKLSSQEDRPFKFEYTPGWPEMEEPEGLTVWDLDDGRAPGILGQLHVILLDNDVDTNEDDVRLKHYTSKIYVDWRFEDMSTQEGTPMFPFGTVDQAVGYAWQGSQLDIFAGNYPEAVLIDTITRLLARSGTVVIGE